MFKLTYGTKTAISVYFQYYILDQINGRGSKKAWKRAYVIYEWSSSSGVAQSAMSPIDMLIMAVPGKPGEDYPILATVPETAFMCEGRTEGGYYADVSCHYLKLIFWLYDQII